MIELLSKLIDIINNDQLDQALISDIPDLGIHLYSKDIHGKYLSCNNEMALNVGFSKGDDILGQTDFDFIWSEKAPFLIENDQKVIFKNEPMFFIEEHILAKGQYLSYKKPLRNHSGKPIGISGLSFTLNKYELLSKIINKNQQIENSQPYENIIFHSNLEKYNLSIQQKNVFII